MARLGPLAPAGKVVNVTVTVTASPSPLQLPFTVVITGTHPLTDPLSVLSFPSFRIFPSVRTDYGWGAAVDKYMKNVKRTIRLTGRIQDSENFQWRRREQRNGALRAFILWHSPRINRENFDGNK